MLPRLLLFLAGFLCCTLQTLAQTYEPGLLVRSKGDTLRGEMETFGAEPPAFIRYRHTPDSPSELFQPRQLRVVRFANGRSFRYEALPIDHAAETAPERLPRGNTANIQTDSLLAEVLVEGTVTLLRVVRPGSTHYLLRQVGQPWLELSERRYLWQAPDGKLVAVDGNTYQGQLAQYFRECPSAVQSAQSAPYTAERLAVVVQTYNKLCGPGQLASASLAKPSRPRQPILLQGGVLAGARYNRISSISLPLTGTCTDCQPHPFGGLYLELMHATRATALYGELILSTFRGKVAQDAGSTSTFSSFDYQAWLGTARLGLRFFLPLTHEQQFLFNFGYELNSVWHPTVTVTAGAPVIQKDELSYASPSLFPNLGVGWRSKQLTISLDGQLYTDVNDNNSIGDFFGNNYALRLGVGYQLNRHSAAATAPAN